MKRCNACNAEFESHFVFCPVDATPLTTDAVQPELHLTLIDNTSLFDRLLKESSSRLRELQRAWPELRRNPVGAGRELAFTGARRLRQSLLAPNSLAAISTALLVLLCAVLILILLDKRSQRLFMARTTLERVHMLEFPPAQNPATGDKGVGAGSNGRVGFRAGKGEGSASQPKKSSGGGGGGNHSKDPAPLGAIPPPSEISAPIPRFPPVQKTSLPVAGVNIDPALWQAMPLAVYGDPRSKASVASNGEGDGGGMGRGNGSGVGEGSGSGVGPGQDGNIGNGRNERGCCGPGGSNGNDADDDPDRIYPPGQATERARVLAKPEPQYTEEARKSGVSGSVVLRVVFSRTGEVTNIRAVSTLPFGLTERAIAAARQIRFRPAMRAGRPINVNMQLEYNFNLY
jgi:TonB family protein